MATRNHAQTWQISNETFYTAFGDEAADEHCELVESMDAQDLSARLFEALRLQYPEHDLQVGDLLHLQCMGYRNDGVFIYDGQRFVDLPSWPDDYGTLPRQFTCPEYPATYWAALNPMSHQSDNFDGYCGIDHNDYIWLSRAVAGQAKANLTAGAPTEFPDAESDYFTRFTYNEKEYLLIIEVNERNGRDVSELLGRLFDQKMTRADFESIDLYYPDRNEEEEGEQANGPINTFPCRYLPSEGFEMAYPEFNGTEHPNVIFLQI